MITPMRPGDRAYVFDNWLKSHADTLYPESDSGRARCMLPRPHYMRAQGLLIEDLLRKATCLVYRSEVDDVVIRGYAVGEVHDGELCLHWLYTRSSRRRQGVATALLEVLASELGCQERGVYTHLKNPGCRWLDARGFRFSPIALRRSV
jgi:GNAT superfamily N-acetyltransferase